MDGSLLAVGTTNFAVDNQNYDFALVKLDAFGALDSAFGNGGKVVYGFDVGGNKQDSAYDFVENANGTLMVCGASSISLPFNYDMACERFLANGEPDSDFTPVLVAFDYGGALTDVAVWLERDVQGRYLLAGHSVRSTNNLDAVLARLLPSGQLDLSFGDKGRMSYGSTLDPDVDFDNQVGNIAIQSDGKILIGSFAATSAHMPDTYSDYKFEVIRVSGDTIFESSFEP